MIITLDIPNELGNRLSPFKKQLPQFLVPKLCLGMPTLKLRLMSPPHQAELGHSHSQTRVHRYLHNLILKPKRPDMMPKLLKLLYRVML
jgi:hypothetical protein